jgi:peroxiredoxin
MTQLREFAQRKADFDRLNTELVALSVDDQTQAHKVFINIGHRQVTILSDPGAQVIRKYGLLHTKGRAEQDISIRATMLIDQEGKEVFRRVSQNVADIPTADEILTRIRNAKR